MEVVRELVVPVAPAVLFEHVSDLDAYEAWMPLIHEVQRLDVESGQLPAWSVELRAQVGPFARSKRLRMERTIFEVNESARFERRESDGKTHAPWTLSAELADRPHPGRVDHVETVLTMRLSYGGALWAGPVLERVLDDQVRRGSDRLLALVTTP